jgi:hypothetical protein
MAKIYKWKVAVRSTCRYIRFSPRPWPTAYYLNGMAMATLQCSDPYGTKSHGPLTLYLAQYDLTPEGKAIHGKFKWITVKEEFATIKEAKSKLDAMIASDPGFFVPEPRYNG